MSVLELEKSVEALPPDELARFAQWFDDYRTHALESGHSPEDLQRRMTLAREHPEILEPWEGTKNHLREQLDD